MRRGAVAVAVAVALASSGCFASWSIVQATDQPRLIEESVRETSVPLPGAREYLQVRMPLGADAQPPQPAVPPATTPPQPAVTPAVQPGTTPPPFALRCQTTQRASDTVYRSAFRYGKKWKYAAVIMFALEAGAAAAFYFSDRDQPANQLAGAVIGLDALGTGVLAFAPRKEIYRSDVRPVSTLIRLDCPDGLALEIAGEKFPVDAAGRIGEVAVAALDAWMQAPSAPIHVVYGEQTVEVLLGSAERCTWNYYHHPQAPTTCPRYGIQVPDVYAGIEVPVGTLSRIE